MKQSLLIASLLLGCTENSINKIDPNNDGDGARIEVEPDWLSYPEAGYGEAVEETFTVRSVGATTLDIEDMVIGGENAASFTIVTPVVSMSLDPEEEADITVVFEPMGANSQVGQVQIASNDQSNPTATVDLVGTGAVPELQISPDPLDFGDSYVGCYKENEVTLANVGPEGSELVIDSMSWEGDAEMAWISTGFTFPFTLGGGEEVTTTFSFNPVYDIDYTGSLVVTSNEPLGTREHAQIGTGKYAGDFTDYWEIPSDPPTDIMFAVDQSCSMDDDISTLSSNFSSFIGQLSGYSNDWQIIVANGDDGCTDSGVLTPTTSGYTSAFQSAVFANGGSFTESLLSVAANAAEQANGGCNNGFMRAGAMLHMVLVSDEPEQSNYTNGQNWSSLVSRIQAAKGSAGSVRVSAIAGPVPSGCGSADAGTGYAEAVSATGGVFLSICSNWASPSNLAMLASASISQANYELTREAVGNTIEVYVNGQLRNPSTWTYDASSNSVILDEPIPEEGDEVQIDYAGAASCD